MVLPSPLLSQPETTTVPESETLIGPPPRLEMSKAGWYQLKYCAMSPDAGHINWPLPKSVTTGMFSRARYCVGTGFGAAGGAPSGTIKTLPDLSWKSSPTSLKGKLRMAWALAWYFLATE